MSSRPESPNASERTPLLSQQDEESQYDAQVNGATAPAAESLQDNEDGSKKPRRWPTIIALTLLCVAAVVVCIGFTVPSIAEEYAQQALVFEPDNLSIDSFTSLGVRARIQGVFYLDASKVRKKPVRDLGRFFTWIAREAETGESDVDVYLPEYDNILLGSATIPSIKVNIRDRYYNHVDILADLEPGDVDGIRRVAKDYLDHRVDSLSIQAVAKVPIRSGLINIGEQTVRQAMKFEGNDVPAVPDFDISKLRLAEYGQPGHPEGVKAKALVSIDNQYPLKFDVPTLGFDILVPDCSKDYLVLATARTDTIHVAPKTPIDAGVTALIRQLPTSLTTACPGSSSSPLDRLVQDYLAGKDATVYIRGGEQDSETPDWIGKLLRDTTLPFSVPGHPFDNLIKEFTLANTHFSLPDPFSEDSRPKISAVVKVLVGLPEEMNIDMDVDRVRADADVFYKGDKFGKLDLRKWQKANATKIDQDILIQSVVDEAPLEITDNDVFSEVVQQLVWGGKGVALDVKAVVDAGTITALGKFIVRNIPAQGKIFVKPIGRNKFSMPTISNMSIYDSTVDSLILQAVANVTNPTEYSAHVPFVNVSVVVNETLVGYAFASTDIVPGPNDVTVRVSFDHTTVGRKWLSQFISGQSTNLTIKTHPGSIRGIPDIGLDFTLPTPHLFGKFLQEATVR